MEKKQNGRRTMTMSLLAIGLGAAAYGIARRLNGNNGGKRLFNIGNFNDNL
jgi:hypothetical protein